MALQKEYTGFGVFSPEEQKAALDKGLGSIDPNAVENAEKYAFYAGQKGANRFYGEGVRPDSYGMDYIDPVSGEERVWISDKGYKKRDEQDKSYNKSTFGRLYTHPNMEKAYPDIVNTKLAKTTDQSIEGQYNPNTNKILLNPTAIAVNAAKNGEKVRSAINKTLLHEMNHKTQQEDGFHITDSTKPSLMNELFGGSSTYYNHPAEAEARATENAYKYKKAIYGRGLGGLRNEMESKSGSREFSTEK